jgi:hypothetical protein
MGSDQRGVLTGQTGMGKSTLANVLIFDKPWLFVLDVKRNFELSREYLIARNPDELDKVSRELHGSKRSAILYRPDPEYSTYEELDLIYKWIYQRGSTFVYIDEMTATVGRSSLSYPPSLRSIITQGRGLGIGVLMATQRPSNLPMYVFSESQKFWKFFLLLRKDQQRMAEWMGDSVLEPRDFPRRSTHTDEYTFFYRDISFRAGASVEYRLGENTVKSLQNKAREYETLALERS